MSSPHTFNHVVLDPRHRRAGQVAGEVERFIFGGMSIYVTATPTRDMISLVRQVGQPISPSNPPGPSEPTEHDRPSGNLDLTSTGTTVKTITENSTADNAYGKPLAKSVTFEYSYKAYESIDEIRLANDMPNDDEIVKIRNAKRQAAARQAERESTFTAMGIVKPTIENDEQLRLRDMFKVLMSSKKYTEEQARDLAASTLGLTWE